MEAKINLTIPSYLKMEFHGACFEASITFPIKEYMKPILDDILRPRYQDHLYFFKNRGTNYMQVRNTFSYKRVDPQTVINSSIVAKNAMKLAMAQAKEYHYKKMVLLIRDEIEETPYNEDNMIRNYESTIV